jgi:hypothetical protein
LAVSRTIPLRLGVLAQVSDDALGLAAACGDLVDDSGHALSVDVHDADGRALAGKAQRPGAPHARSRRRHDANLVLEPHVSSRLNGPTILADSHAAINQQFSDPGR